MKCPECGSSSIMVYNDGDTDEFVDAQCTTCGYLTKDISEFNKKCET